MKKTSTGIRLSASDLSNHLSCRHLTTLDMDVAIGGKGAPVWNSPDARILQERGVAHEHSYVEHLKSTGLAAVNFRAFGNDDKLVGETLLAMQAGVDVIVQAAFGDTDWFGRVDVLRRVDKPSRLGSWSYEAYDCKLAHETKAATILQLSLYSQLVGAAQGLLPDAMYVVPPGETFEPERYRTLDYAAYYRYVKSRLEAVTGANGVGPATYPEPTPHCDICRWQQECDKERRRDDHLSLVAGINKLQRKQLGAWETTTVAGLAAYPLPITQRPVHGSRESYIRVREQARVQVAGRESGTPVHEVLQMSDEHGLSLLPEPSPGDVFFDLEGDPFVGPNGREYLFGFALPDGTYESRWGLTTDQERDAFVWFVDLVMAKWAEHPGMHLYHYSPYEPSALKRLMGRYGVREDEVDEADELGKNWQRAYDGLGRLMSVMEPNASNVPAIETDYTYDFLDNLTEVDQYGGAKGNGTYVDRKRTFTYDSLSRLTCSANPETSTAACPSSNGVSNYSYDANGNLQTRTDPRGVVTDYTYDTLNRITLKSYPTIPSGVAATSSVGYTYDAAISGWGWPAQSSPSYPTTSQTNLIGRLSEVTVGSVGANAWIVYGYDSMGRTVLKSECLPIDCGNNHHDLHYRYDYAGNTSFYDRGLNDDNNSEYPNQGYYFGGFTQTFDGAGNVATVTGDTAGTNTATNIYSDTDYLPTGQLYTSLELGLYNIKNSFNDRDWYTGQVITDTANQSIWNSSASYNANGTVSATTDSYAGDWSFSYDQLNRVFTATAPAGKTQYSIDPFGSKYLATTISGTAPAPTYSAAATNALTGNGLTYDLGTVSAPVGNVIYDGFHHYTYDAEGRLYSVDGTTCYTYDGEDNRVATTNCNVVNNGNGNTTGITSEFLYDFHGRLMSQVNASTEKMVRANLYAGSDYLGEDAADAYATNSPTASLLRITDQVGNLRGRYDLGANWDGACTSFPYGDGMSCTVSPYSTAVFARKDRDTESAGPNPLSGLDYFGARYYSSSMGRFMSPDPVGGSLLNPQTLNKYAYVINNPLTNTDPTGLYVCATGQDCTAFEKSLDALRNSKNGDVSRAAGAYGALGDKNGVTVGFADLSKQGEDGKVTSSLGTDANGNLQAQSNVTINTGATGAAYDAAIGHEGSHVADAQDVVKSIVVDPKTGDFTVGNNITRYQSEQRAYGVTNAILSSEGVKANEGCDGCNLGQGTMQGQVPGIVNRIMNTGSNYMSGGQHMGPKNQGGSVVNGVDQTPKAAVPH